MWKIQIKWGGDYEGLGDDHEEQGDDQEVHVRAMSPKRFEPLP